MSWQEILLMSHGKTKSGKKTDGGGRELRTSAKRQAQKLGTWLRENDLAPDVTVAAPSQAAIVCAEKALKAGGWTAEGIIRDTSLSIGSIDTRIEDLDGRTGQRLFCVSDADTVSRILERLLPGSPALPPGAVLRLSRARRGQPVTLEAVVTADALPDGFPYPLPDGPERRDRPAYYYTQSAALPYRQQDGRVEVMVITSSSGRKWGIPKGICEPGLTAQASAAQEAREEAGICGQIHEARVGRYMVAKWGAVCSVDVYPMLVEKVFPDASWDEADRKREWLSRDAAAQRVSNPDLARIVASADLQPLE